MQMIAALGLVIAGFALVAFGAHQHGKPVRPQDAEWDERHPLIAKLLAGPTANPKNPPTVESTGAITFILGGVFLVVVGIAYAFG